MGGGGENTTGWLIFLMRYHKDRGPGFSEASKEHITHVCHLILSFKGNLDLVQVTYTSETIQPLNKSHSSLQKDASFPPGICLACSIIVIAASVQEGPVVVLGFACLEKLLPFQPQPQLAPWSSRENSLAKVNVWHDGI